VDLRGRVWFLESNHSEKTARVKNSEVGNTFSVLHLFKLAGCTLPKALKEPFQSALEGAACGPCESGGSGLRALADKPAVLALQDLAGATGGGRGGKTCAAEPALAAGGPCGKMSLQQDESGRYRLATKRTAEQGEESTLLAQPPPPGPRRRLSRKTSEEEAANQQALPAAEGGPENLKCDTAEPADPEIPEEPARATPTEVAESDED
jgi:hypothetical protein